MEVSVGHKFLVSIYIVARSMPTFDLFS